MERRRARFLLRLVAVLSPTVLLVLGTTAARVPATTASGLRPSRVAASGLSTGLDLPARVVVDAAGNVYVADTFNDVIRKLDIAGNISTVAGTGAAGFSGDGGPATAATLSFPMGMAFDPAGNLYFADEGNNRIRK